MATAERLDSPLPIDHRPLHLVEVDDRPPGPGEVEIDVACCAVCRTDLQIVEGDLAAPHLPLVPGHQAVGRIVRVGSGVTDRRLGQKVGVAWLAGTYGSCRFCVSGRENLCQWAVFTGLDRDGGYATRMTARADFTFPLPDHHNDAELAPLLCGGVIGFRSLQISGIESGQRLGLFGFGASALLTIQVAVYWGCEVFVATRSPAEQARARELGAVWAGGYEHPLPSLLDAAITFAPAGEVVVAALRSLDRGGTVAINAIHLDRVPEFDYQALWWERQIRSVANFTRADARQFLALAAEIPIRTMPVAYPLAQANEALADLKAGKVGGAAVLVP